jgi:hypothetical protein
VNVHVSPLHVNSIGSHEAYAGTVATGAERINLKVPAGQLVQVGVGYSVVYSPGRQYEQAEVEDDGGYIPYAQDSHADAVSNEYFPSGHERHSVAVVD